MFGLLVSREELEIGDEIDILTASASVVQILREQDDKSAK